MDSALKPFEDSGDAMRPTPGIGVLVTHYIQTFKPLCEFGMEDSHPMPLSRSDQATRSVVAAVVAFKPNQARRTH